MDKTLRAILVILLVVSVVGNLYLIFENSNLTSVNINLTSENSDLITKYDGVVNEYNNLAHKHNELNQSYQNFLFKSEENYTTFTILYYTNFSENQQIISLSVPYEKYESYHKRNHPSWEKNNLAPVEEYITSNETIIIQIVETVKNITQSEEELANALLNLVQDKMYGTNIRYYPTTELKYPIETLVEMGGDCDTHSILYGTLMKAAGFDVILLYSNETLDDGQHHVAIAVHLEDPPQHSLEEYEDSVYIHNEQNYYYAETTQAYWRVGDLPPKFENVTFQVMPLS